MHYADSNAELKEVYDDIKTTFEINFVPNFFKCQGCNIELLKATWTQVKVVLFTGTVPRGVKEEIIYRISKAKNCQYCSFVHAKFIDELQQKIKLLKGENEVELLTADEEEAVNLLVETVLGQKKGVEENLAKFETLGFTPQQIPELVATASLTLMLNTYADIAGINLDEELLSG